MIKKAWLAHYKAVDVLVSALRIELLTWLTICSLSIISICNFGLFPHFGFEGRTLVLTAQVRGHSLLFTFYSFCDACKQTNYSNRLSFASYTLDNFDSRLTNVQQSKCKILGIGQTSSSISIYCTESSIASGNQSRQLIKLPPNSVVLLLTYKTLPLADSIIGTKLCELR